jgi:rhomboid family GlyGly-CTERM serine protease
MSTPSHAAQGAAAQLIPSRQLSSPPRIAGTAIWLAALLAPQIAALAWPNLADHLVYDRSAIAAGEVWRIATGHLMHGSLVHWAFDSFALAALAGVMAAARLPGLGTIVVSSMLAVSGALWFLRPDIEVYVGLSGIDSALFVGVALGLAARLEGLGRVLAWGCLVLFGAKVLFEGLTGFAIFARTNDVLYEAHLAGALAAVLVVGIRSVIESRRGRLVRSFRATTASCDRSSENDAAVGDGPPAATRASRRLQLFLGLGVPQAAAVAVDLWSFHLGSQVLIQRFLGLFWLVQFLVTPIVIFRALPAPSPPGNDLAFLEKLLLTLTGSFGWYVIAGITQLVVLWSLWGLPFG